MFERLALACEKVLIGFACLSMTALMLLTTADAGMRYLFNAPIIGAYELTERYLVTSGIFLAFSYAYRADVFIRVSFFIDRIPAGARLVFDHVAQIVTLGYCAFFTYASLDQAIRGMDEGSNMSALAIPLAPSYFLVPIGFAVMGFLVVVDLPKVVRGTSRLLPRQVEGDTSQSVT
jgi:TRAP-type C4-dicarboxylate transport system permease small subunit